MDDKILILDKPSIEARLERIAYEIFERNYHEQEVYIIGIDQRGGYLAEEISTRLSRISNLEVRLEHAGVDRDDESGLLGIRLSADDLASLKNKILVVVDDVLYTGRTLINVVSILLQTLPKEIQTAILIDRGHRSMPVSPDFVGLELATTLHQHVLVQIDEEAEEMNAYLQ